MQITVLLGVAVLLALHAHANTLLGKVTNVADGRIISGRD